MRQNPTICISVPSFRPEREVSENEQMRENEQEEQCIDQNKE